MTWMRDGPGDGPPPRVLAVGIELKGISVDDLDCRLAALGRVEIDRDLGGIESAVWAQIEAEEPALCAGAALFASFIGFVQPAHMSAFAVHMPVAPSTILGD